MGDYPRISRKKKLKIRRNRINESFNPLTSDHLLKDLFISLDQKCSDKIYITVPDIPLTLNHQKGRNKYTKQPFLKEQVHQYRMLMRLSCNKQLIKPPNSLSLAFCFFESPKWITLKNEVRRVDADNFIKPTLDAFEQATGYEDEKIWCSMGFKVGSVKNVTHLVMYFFGDIINFHKV